MIAHPFALHVPGSLEEALDLLREHGSECRPLAGGTVLLPELQAGRARPRLIVDLRRTGLGSVERSDSALSVGACATYRRLAAEEGLLGAFARAVTGGAQIRNAATIGGSAAWANPSSDAPCVLVALDALLVLASSAGRRRVPASEFFVDAFRTAARPEEALVALELPVEPVARFGYSKLKFGESSWPIVTAAAVERSGSLRVAIGGAAAVPFAVEGGSADEVGEMVSAALSEPWSDVLASGAYRRRVAPVVARRAVDALS